METTPEVKQKATIDLPSRRYLRWNQERLVELLSSPRYPAYVSNDETMGNGLIELLCEPDGKKFWAKSKKLGLI